MESAPNDDQVNDGFMDVWGAALRQVNRDLSLPDQNEPSLSQLNLLFLAFLRTRSSFGVFNFGPLRIHVPSVEDAVIASLGKTEHGDAEWDSRLSNLIEEARQEEGRARVEDLHVLLAFMRIGAGVPGEVFSRQDVSPEQIRIFARLGSADFSPPSPESLLSPDEVAAYLKVHPHTVREWIRSGRLPAIRLAGLRALRIRAEDLQAVMEPT